MFLLSESVYGDVTFNVGGPVWAMDWCPVPGIYLVQIDQVSIKNI